MLYTLNVYSAVYQLYLNKIEKKDSKIVYGKPVNISVINI